MKKVLFILFAIAIITSGCTSFGGDAGKPRVVVDSPAHGATVGIGQALSITVRALGKKGIKRVVMSVDGKPAGVANAPGGRPVRVLPVMFKWTPVSPGMHVITVKAYDIAGEESDPAILQVTVAVGTVVTHTATSSARVPGTAAAAPAKRTVAPAVTTPEAAKVSPVGASPGSVKENRPYLVTLVNLNVRSGPGTDYPVVGRLPRGERALINGKSVDGSWWRIEFPSGTGAYGWVSAYYVTPHNADNVPVVKALLPPPTPTWTPTPTSAPVTPQPGSTGEAVAVAIRFTADKTTLQVGECTSLHWSVDNVSAVYLDGAGVTGHGDKRVCPGSTTTYILHVVKRDGSSEDRRVTITVTGNP